MSPSTNKKQRKKHATSGAGENTEMETMTKSLAEISLDSGNSSNDPSKPPCWHCTLASHLNGTPVSSNPPEKYAILPSCNHPICLDCGSYKRQILEFRREQCVYTTPDTPHHAIVCFKMSPFCVPSEKFVTGAEKTALIKAYLEEQAKIPCEHYELDKTCPFRDACVRAHTLSNGKRAINVKKPHELEGGPANHNAGEDFQTKKQRAPDPTNVPKRFRNVDESKEFIGKARVFCDDKAEMVYKHTETLALYEFVDRYLSAVEEGKISFDGLWERIRNIIEYGCCYRLVGTRWNQLYQTVTEWYEHPEKYHLDKAHIQKRLTIAENLAYAEMAKRQNEPFTVRIAPDGTSQYVGNPRLGGGRGAVPKYVGYSAIVKSRSGGGSSQGKD